MGKKSSCNAGHTGDVGSFPGLWRSSRGKNATHSSILTWTITVGRRHVPIGHLYDLFGAMSINVFCPFFDWVLILLWLSCMRYLYILEIKLLSVTSFANIFSHSVGCLFFFFYFFTVSFAVQRFVSLIRSHLFIFVLITIALVH